MSDINAYKAHEKRIKDPNFRGEKKTKRLGNLKDKKDKKSKLRNTKFYGYTNTQQY